MRLVITLMLHQSSKYKKHDTIMPLIDLFHQSSKYNIVTPIHLEAEKSTSYAWVRLLMMSIGHTDFSLKKSCFHSNRIHTHRTV